MKTNPLFIDVPTEITTDRLRLRAAQAGDGVVIGPAARASEAELKLWMPWAANGYDEVAAETWARESAAKFLLRQVFHFLIFTEADGHVGSIGVHDLDWAVPACQIGYWLGTPFVGRGYMTEALNALTTFAMETLQVVRVEVRADARNKRSRRVAERCEFTLEATLRKCKRDNASELADECVYAKVI